MIDSDPNSTRTVRDIPFSTPLEVAAMDAIQAHGLCLTLAVHGNRKHLPAEVLEQLEKLTNVLERHFMEAVGIIRAHRKPTRGRPMRGWQEIGL